MKLVVDDRSDVVERGAIAALPRPQQCRQVIAASRHEAIEPGHDNVVKPRRGRVRHDVAEQLGLITPTVSYVRAGCG
jgi:hypothetical protein